MYEPDEHAVRWSQRESKNISLPDFCEWTKWHWTANGDFTICGWMIIVGRPGNVPMFPETDERAERVNCGNCLRIMKGKQNGI